MIKLNQLSFSEYDLNEILKSSEANKLVLFIGAGFSKFSETDLVKIPTWGELINELKDELGLSGESDFLKIAQLYFLKYGQHSYVKKVKSSIKDLDPSPFHKKLFEFNPRYIITTNWDDLLEKTARDVGLAYDLVASDVDLAQSHLDKKIIKMHGDFRQNNFVFKEDDYLQYSQNFPLIENFVKGIFSTSTVIFLGYSFNDYDLKQIVSWVTTISKATPRKFLLQKNYDDAQALYLRNHGISLLTPTKTDIDYHDLYSEFFNDFRVVKNQEELIKRTISSAEAEEEKIENAKMMSDADKLKLRREVQDLVKGKVRKFVDGKLKALTQYNILLPEQISRKLTNCIIEYKKSDVTLISDKSFATNDFDKHIRKINNIYLNDVLTKNSESAQKFSSILEKALISEVMYDSRLCKVSESSEMDEGLYKKLTFGYAKESAEILIINKNYAKLLDLLTSKVKHYINEKNYILATISMANFDNIYRICRVQINIGRGDFNKDDLMKIERMSPFDYKSKVIDFPRELQSDLQDLIKILEFNEIYKAYYRFDVESKKNLGFSNTRKNGGIVFSSDEFKMRARLYPYVYFILGNEILIEEYAEIRQLFEFNMLGSFEHYLLEDRFYVNVIDLFILMKYCETNKLKDFSIELVRDRKIISASLLDGRKLYNIKRYLLVTLSNMCNLMNLRNSNSIHTTSIDRWTNNLLIVLGLVKWNPIQLKKIINNLIPLLERRTHNMVVYESIVSLISVNAHLYHSFHPDILKIIDVVLEKILKEKFNGFDQQIILLGTMRNIFSLTENNNYKYDNINLLNLVLLKIKSFNEEMKKFITNNLLIDIKGIGSDAVKIAIDDFVRENILNLLLKTPKDIMDRLLLIVHGYPAPEGFSGVIEKFVSDNIPNNLTELDIITAGVESDLPALLKILIEDKGFVEFKVALDNFNQRMKTLKR
ncbi:SIR2 family protein [Pectobacterium brasiliense]|uniref:SIR2 family protein n=1 Tax=Pectobacterium brasiliense TaxID=180957 RepID=UPI000CE694E7|nr:SIR2 family protein [Pectobacterium brasiliense]MBN3098828.1 SIR2 family protein [Pectobacterium brasiliense]MBN3100643.1 SIR2 family protein [Pectobacterium brasiliense]MBN3166982.1 SIR2 family protein [Pectobacterium brasiliense]MBN3183915.1 SIR2 family protein [Pectobacterium brasiliense]PPE59071.1 hypothetical protein F152LOC_03305 [Pectobacterium brasiliense]